MKHSILWILSIALSFPLMGQVVSSDPLFPTPDQEITIIFNASEGNRGLENCNCEVFMHTGLITEQSSSGTDWKFVQGEWGKDIPRLKMTKIEDNKYSYTLTIREFYQVPAAEEILQLAFVFRNVDGSKAGRAPDGSDIFLDIFSDEEALITTLVEPSTPNIFIRQGETIRIEGRTNAAANLSLEENGVSLFQSNGQTNSLTFDYTPNHGPGNYTIDFIASLPSGLMDTTSFQYFVLPEINVLDPDRELQLGLNRNTDGTATFVLNAPNKEFAFLLMDINQFEPQVEYLMNKSTDGQLFWITLPAFEIQNNWHTYQYLVDGSIYIADPMSELILDPNNDQFISTSKFPDGFPEYPERGVGLVSAFTFEGFAYNWENNASFNPPPKEKLVIYEVLMRDFLASRDYEDLIDTLSYLKRLGVNAIELMPVNEFEGNDSWGYNPSFHMALDKYYGDPLSFKRFVDEAHRKGIAVILDVVYNHAFSQSPLAQLYWDEQNFRPSQDNPWLNVSPKHPFNVGYDFNHESPQTRRFVDQVLSYWLKEFNIDGFRFDLSKGFTQTDYGDDVGRWSSYDSGRIGILKHYADVVWGAKPEAYVIFEHFAENREEQELAEYGALLWNNMNHQYNEATMGYSSDLRGASFQQRGWTSPGLITYMESHDEERLMYKNLQFGNSQGAYNVKHLTTALERMELATTFFYTIPGPKMLWQFGELGFDFSINYCRSGVVDNCRLDPKPIRWDYLQNNDRARLSEITAGIIDLVQSYEVFQTNEVSLNVVNPIKSIHLNHPDFNVAIFGNFDVQSGSIDPQFQSTGTWFEYFTGDSLEVSNPNSPLHLQPGEYRLYTSKNRGRLITSSEPILNTINQFKVWPNPASSQFNLEIELKKASTINVQLLDLNGTLISERSFGLIPSGKQALKLATPSPSGSYFVILQLENGLSVYQKVIVLD